MAAEDCTAAQVALTVRHTTGILCAPMTAQRAKELKLPRMVKRNEDPNGTAFTVTCDSIHTTTGVSAKDRMQTYHDLANVKRGANDFSRPGHVFPLIAKEGGVLERRGHTEAGVDLCRMAGKSPVALIAELCNDDGTMMRLDDCAKFAQDKGLVLITVDAMVEYLNKHGQPQSEKPYSSSSHVVYSGPYVSEEQKDVESSMSAIAQKSGCLPVPMMRVVTDAGGLIVCMNDEFVRFTGYGKEEMLGKKCNFLQGDDTDPGDVTDIRAALNNKERCTVVILNYKKDGTRFWNLLAIKPLLHNTTGELTYFVGDIVSLPIPPQCNTNASSGRPHLCVDDVLSLLTVLSSIPRSVGRANSALALENGSQQNRNIAWPQASTTEMVPIGDGLDFVASTMLPTSHGRFRVLAYRNRSTKAEPLALIVGDVAGASELPVRVHDQCLTSEVFGSLRCDCQQQLQNALKYIHTKERGIVIYLPQEGRGIGLANKIAAYALQEQGYDTVDANRELNLPDDARQYGCVAAILRHLDVESIALLTNNPRKIECLRDAGVKVVVRIPCKVPRKEQAKEARHYIRTKTKRMGHML